MWDYDYYDEPDHEIRFYAFEGAEGNLDERISRLPKIDQGLLVGGTWIREWTGTKSMVSDYMFDLISCRITPCWAQLQYEGRRQWANEDYCWRIEIKRPVTFSVNPKWRKGRGSLKRVRRGFYAYAVRMLPTGIGDYDARLNILVGSCTSWADAVKQVTEHVDLRAIVEHFGRQWFDRSKWFEIRRTVENMYSGTTERFFAPSHGGVDPICMARLDGMAEVLKQWEDVERVSFVAGPDERGKGYLMNSVFRHSAVPMEIEWHDWAAEVLGNSGDVDMIE